MSLLARETESPGRRGRVIGEEKPYKEDAR